MYSDLEGAVVGKCPGSINGQQFLIQNCKVVPHVAKERVSYSVAMLTGLCNISV